MFFSFETLSSLSSPPQSSERPRPGSTHSVSSRRLGARLWRCGNVCKVKCFVYRFTLRKTFKKTPPERHLSSSVACNATDHFFFKSFDLTFVCQTFGGCSLLLSKKLHPFIRQARTVLVHHSCERREAPSLPVGKGKTFPIGRHHGGTARRGVHGDGKSTTSPPPLSIISRPFFKKKKGFI